MTVPPTRSPAVNPAPAVAAGVFGDRLPLATCYAELLAGPALERGLVGPREVPRLWDRHLLNCAVIADRIPRDATVCDLGSGAGLPGLVLAIARADLRITLLEPSLRRCTFLHEAVDALGLEAVTVRRGRAEELAGVMAFDVVTARAVAPLERLAAWSLPLLTPGGLLLALKGATAEREVAASRAALRRLGAVDVAVSMVEAGVLSEPTWVVSIRAPAGRPARAAQRGRRGRRTRDERPGDRVDEPDGGGPRKRDHHREREMP